MVECLETISPEIEKEVYDYLTQLRNGTKGDTLVSSFDMDQSTYLTLIVESPITRKEVIDDLALTIIYREPPFTADTFRGRTLCGVVYRTPLVGGDSYDALRLSLRLCKEYEIPVHVSHQ